MGYRVRDPEEAPVSWPIPCEPVELLSPLPTWLRLQEEMPRRAGSPRSDAVKWKEIASGAVKKRFFFPPKIPDKQVFQFAFAGCHDDLARYLSLKSKFVVTGCNFKKENSLESKKTEYTITEQSGGFFSFEKGSDINSLNYLCA